MAQHNVLDFFVFIIGETQSRELWDSGGFAQFHSQRYIYIQDFWEFSASAYRRVSTTQLSILLLLAPRSCFFPKTTFRNSYGFYGL